MTRRELEVRCRQLEVLLAAAALDAGGDLIVPAATLARLDPSTRYTLSKDERGVVFSVRQPDPDPPMTCPNGDPWCPCTDGDVVHEAVGTSPATPQPLIIVTD